MRRTPTPRRIGQTARSRGIPRLLAALALLAAPAAAEAQVVVGMVFDEEAGKPLQGVEVQGLTPDLKPVHSVVSDAFGRFHLELEEPGTFVVVASRAGYATSSPEVVELAAGEETNLMLGIRSLHPAVDVRERASTDRTAYIYGRVVEEGGREPIEGAEVTLPERGKRVLTNATGRFVFQNVGEGITNIRVEHLAYGSQQKELVVQPEAAYEVNVSMESEAIELEGITVTARSRIVARRLEPIFARMDRGTVGHFLTRDDFARRGYPRVVQAIQNLPSTKVRRDRNGQWHVVFRSAGGFGAPSVFGTGGCEPAIYLDGQRIHRPGDPPSPFLDDSTNEIELIEVYPGAASLPAEYNDPGTFCAIGIWSRRGG